MPVPAFARFARAVLPPGARRWLRRAAREAPHRLRDLPKDLAGAVAPTAFGGPIPPARLRARVGFVGSRDEFTLVGREGARVILEALSRSFIGEGRRNADWLDFGCGCGRLARPLIESGVPGSYTGVDVDAQQVAWAARHLAGTFAVMRPEPPLAFPDASFDVILAISIFTHFTEEEQFAWLSEMQRLLKPGGLLLATTLPTEFAAATPGLSGSDLAEVAQRGFLAVGRGAAAFNERSTFHSPDYLEREWGRFLRFRSHLPRAFVSYQDLSAWEQTSAPR